ncbi:phospholipase A [Novosphingobium sp. BL-8A]|uniref:phospholipase A n=1 Tax=Novosphingobium sp. BL-8A TaxID=3127639 RepID=UPI003757CA43
MTDRLTAIRPSHGLFRRVAPGLSALAFLISSPAHADEAIETLISGLSAPDADGTITVDLRFLNPGASPATVTLPERIAATLAGPDRQETVYLDRSAQVPGSVIVAPQGFARVRYRLPPGFAAGDATLSIPQWKTAEIALHVPSDSKPADIKLAEAPPPAHSEPSAPSSGPPADRSVGNAFIGNLAPYEPIYAVYGPGTNTEARLQISFEYHLFGSRSASDMPMSWRDGLHLAYTQRMFWDLRAKSMPFRNIDYQPEIIYVSPAKVFDGGISLALQGGLRHESNGRDGDDSRSVNSLYVAPMAAIPLRGDWRVLVAPKLSFYIGDKSDNPDIVRYRGHAGLFLQVGDPDGIRVSTNTRFNFSSGKGAINTEVSYPLPRLLGGGPDLYLFAQGFAGYGENLLDYNRSITRLRFGFALVR